MTMVTIEEAQANLKALIHQLLPGAELIITENERPVAKLVGGLSPHNQAGRPGPGLCKGAITYMSADFDAPVEDMKEYME